VTVHMKVYESLQTPTVPLFVYDYKNTIDHITEDGWYNFDVQVMDENHGYTASSDFDGSYFLVLSSSGGDHDNFVIWEMEDNDEYMVSPSAIRL
jgi:hypothetical protein